MSSTRAWVKIGRPDVGADRRTIDGHRRPITVGGDVVGWIVPLTVGTPQDATRVPRWAKWEVRDTSFQCIVRCPSLACALYCARAWDGWPMGCWVYMSGDHGYMPDNVGCCVGRYGAVSGLIDLFSLGDGRRARALRSDGYTELSKRGGAGAEYAEVSRCSCSTCATVTIETADNWECSECSG